MSQYNPSAAAMAAAHALWRNLEFHEKGQTAATEKNVAILIDLFTQVFRLEAVLQRVVHTVPWFDRMQLAAHIEQAREALRALEIARQGIPKFEGKVNGPSAPARAAATALFKHFDILHRPQSRIRLPREYTNPSPSEHNLAVAIDTATNVFRIEAVIDTQVSEILKLERASLKRQVETLREVVRAVELVRNRLPSYARNPMFIRKSAEVEPPKLTVEQKRYLGHVSKALRESGTVEEYQSVLKKAGIAE